MIFKIDKTKVTEGEIIEVKWQCSDADNVSLTLDNGTNASTMTVEKEGTKKFRLNRIGTTTVTIIQNKNGKSSKKSGKVKVSAKKYDTYQRVGDNRLKEWFSSLGKRIGNYFQKMKYGWGMMPKEKKQATTTLSIILIIMIISSFFPSIVFFGLSLLAVYCFYILMKR